MKKFCLEIIYLPCSTGMHYTCIYTYIGNNNKVYSKLTHDYKAARKVMCHMMKRSGNKLLYHINQYSPSIISKRIWE